MKKAIFGILLAIGLVFCVSPAVFAEDWTEVSTDADLITQLNAGGNIKLGADLTLTDDVYTSNAIQLDLNGKKLTTGNNSIVAYEDLKILDASEGKTGTIFAEGPTYGPLYIHGDETDFVFESGTIDAAAMGIRSDAKSTTISGGTIKSDKSGVYITGGEFTISGGKISAGYQDSNSNYVAVDIIGADTKATISGGEISSQYYAVEVAQDAKLTVSGGKIEGGEYGITIWGDSVVTIDNGEIIAHSDSAISTNGTTASPQLTVNGGTITCENGLGIYAPAKGNSKTIINGGKITGGESAIEIRAGELEINGGELISTADTYSATPNGNGSTTTGAAIAIAQHTTQQNVTVTICGGTFKALVPFSEANPQGNNATAIDKVGAEITTCDGVDEPRFISTGAKAVESEDLVGFIKAGYFEPEIDDSLIASGYTKKARGTGYMISNAWLEVVVETPENGTASASLTDVLEGEEVEITTTPDAGYELDTITVKDADGANVTVSNGNFTMPAKNVTVTATFKKIKRIITVTSPENGTATASVETAAEGDEVTVTTTAADGYELDTITVKDADGNEITVTNGKFTMPAKAVTISVTFKELPEEPVVTPEEPKTDAENPNTYDDIAVWFVTMGASIAGLGAVIVMKKF